MNNKRLQSATAPFKKKIKDLYVELGHPSETITSAMAKALGIQVTSTFKLYEDCTLGKATKHAISKKAVPCTKFLGKWLIFFT